ncbi:hypothetical protein ACFSL4_01440 [Streptomyces caeni]|uniref:Uncharacterized protein n=1 Tax=Streptomyces caeni TaxID=2307231 RepID=A0ABW4IHX2_9ACTN
MSGGETREVTLQIRPGEDLGAFIRRVAASAPPAPPEVIDRLRTLLPIDTPAPGGRTAPRQPVRAAA